MKKIIVLLLSLVIVVVFSACNNPQENSSDTIYESSVLADTYSELRSVEEAVSSDNTSDEVTTTPSTDTSSTQTTTSSSTNVASSTPAATGCTHPDYWEGRGEGFHFITGWRDKEPGIENKSELLAHKCEDTRDVVYKCPVCLEPVLLETLEPLGHDFSGEEEIVMYPSVNKEGSWGIVCQGRVGYCGEVLFTTSIPKRGGSYDTVDSCFTVDIGSRTNLESYNIDEHNISIGDYRTWGSVPTIEFDIETYTGTISYTLQDGTLYKRNIYVDKSIMTEGVCYHGEILESGEFKQRYFSLTSNGTGPS